METVREDRVPRVDLSDGPGRHVDVVRDDLPGEGLEVVRQSSTRKKMAAAAEAAGLKPSLTPTLLVQGDDRPGLEHAMARALGDAGINLVFLVAQVIGRRYSAVFRFESAADAQRAVGLLKKAKPAR
jgi:hypothetical protein